MFGTPPHTPQIDARISDSLAARFGVRASCKGVSAQVVQDRVQDFAQLAATFGAGLTWIELDLHGATDLLECDRAPPFSVASRCFCFARYSRLTVVSTM